MRFRIAMASGILARRARSRKNDLVRIAESFSATATFYTLIPAAFCADDWSKDVHAERRLRAPGDRVRVGGVESEGSRVSGWEMTTTGKFGAEFLQGLKRLRKPNLRRPFRPRVLQQ